ncbi:MAG TPA: sigma-70 family RNA polymerase sigma factor [Bryobacteraceae bacterium]|nr:sigma-70 family RNA polymerase sigma factor [Bryobacteraceae bacterium]
MQKFDAVVAPWLNSAFNLARWLTGNAHDAEDIVQEACLRAFRALDSFHPGNDGRAWLLTIVRNTAWNWLRQNRGHEPLADSDMIETSLDPEAALIRKADVESVRRALEALPPEHREVIVFREMESMSYREIADVIGAPIGTVMSRLSRARAALHASFHAEEAHR